MVCPIRSASFFIWESVVPFSIQLESLLNEINNQLLFAASSIKGDEPSWVIPTALLSNDFSAVVLCKLLGRAHGWILAEKDALSSFRNKKQTWPEDQEKETS